MGASALQNNTTGSYNSAMGSFALAANTTGAGNVAVGDSAIQGDGITPVTGSTNQAVGTLTLLNLTTGTFNTGMGGNPLVNNRDGAQNVAFGTSNLFSNVSGSFQTAIGRDSLRLNTSSVATFGAITGGSGYTDGTYNGVTLAFNSSTNAIGVTFPTADIVVSGGSVTSVTLVGSGGVINTSMIFTAPAASIGGTGSGFQILVATTASGARNTALGWRAGRNNINGSANVFLGYEAGTNETGSNKLYISNTNTSTPLIAGDFDAAGGTAGRVKINGNLEIKTKTPATSAAAGTVGEIAWDADYIYIATATNTWKRVAIATW